MRNLLSEWRLILLGVLITAAVFALVQWSESKQAKKDTIGAVCSLITDEHVEEKGLFNTIKRSVFVKDTTKEGLAKIIEYQDTKAFEEYPQANIVSVICFTSVENFKKWNWIASSDHDIRNNPRLGLTPKPIDIMYNNSLR